MFTPSFDIAFRHDPPSGVHHIELHLVRVSLYIRNVSQPFQRGVHDPPRQVLLAPSFCGQVVRPHRDVASVLEVFCIRLSVRWQPAVADRVHHSFDPVLRLPERPVDGVSVDCLSLQTGAHNRSGPGDMAYNCVWRYWRALHSRLPGSSSQPGRRRRRRRRCIDWGQRFAWNNGLILQTAGKNVSLPIVEGQGPYFGRRAEV